LSKLSVQAGTAEFHFYGHTETVFSIYLYKEVLFSGSADTQLLSWNINNGEYIRGYAGHSNWVNSVAVFDDHLYSGGDDGIVLKWNIDDGQLLATFTLDNRALVSCMAYRERTLFVGSFDPKVVMFDSASGNALKLYEGKNSKLLAVAVWKSLVISGSDGGEIKAWDSSVNTIDPDFAAIVHLYGVTSLSLQNDFLFSGSADGTVKQWILPSLILFRTFEGMIPLFGVLKSLVLADSIFVIAVDASFLYAGGSEAFIYQWNTTLGIQTGFFSGHSDSIGNMLISANRLYSGGRDKTIRIWDTQLFESIRMFNTLGAVTGFVVTEDSIISCTESGMEMISISTGQRMISLSENVFCNCIVSLGNRVYTGSTDSIIRARDMSTLSVLEMYQGHLEYISDLAFDETNILYSSSLDGSVKKWNFALRKVAFSFENREGSVTSLICNSNQLFVGLKSGLIYSYNVDNAVVTRNLSYHDNAISSMIYVNDSIASSGLDGLIMQFSVNNSLYSSVLYRSTKQPLKGLTINTVYLMAIEEENQIVLLPRRNYTLTRKTTEFQTPLLCLAATEEHIFAGSKSGIIFTWKIETLQLSFELKGHVSPVNNLLIADNRLFSASDDKSIIEWTLKSEPAIKTYKRQSASALGHLGPVNSLSYYSDTLFSAGSDLTVRRWNTKTGKHDDVYFGFAKSVTTVICYNGSVFAGSEDFSVLMFNPILRRNQERTVQLTTTTPKKTTNQKRIIRLQKAEKFSMNVSQVIIPVAITLALIILVICVYVLLKQKSKKIVSQTEPSAIVSGTASSQTIVDLETIVNSVMGISKHAAFLVESSAIAQVKKIAAGGGGELFLAKIMDPTLRKKHGDSLIQKIVFIKIKASEEAFYQEVGILIMLSTFPGFCQIIGYTENPSSMLLKFYSDGSLFDLIRRRKLGTITNVKLLIDVSAALNVMHSHYLAHCDIKTQNVLVELDNGIPGCFLTDFGITQILSDKIIASRSFNVINLRGLSVFYAAPEAFTCFREKNYARTDFKKYDLYSFGCLIYEILTRKSPWA
jgi:WD40 repeat protein